MVFVKELWRGDVSLAFTYWVVLVIGNFLFVLNDMYWEASGFYNVMTFEKVVSFWTFIAVGIIYFLFTAVCVWRSANKYKGRILWPILAKAVVVFGVMRTIVDITKILGWA